MPTSLADLIYDNLVVHTSELRRVEEGLLEDVDAALRDLADELAANLGKLDPTGATGKSQLRRLVKLTDANNEVIDAVFGELNDSQRRLLEEVVSTEQAGLLDAINKPAAIQLANKRLNAATISRIVDDTLVQGDVMKEWWGGLSKDVKARVEKEMRMGLLAGESTAELRKRLNDVTGWGNVQSQRVARTSMQSVIQQARLDVLKANSDVIGGMQWVARLDTRTSDICIGLDNQVWDLEGNPVDARDPFPGPPPAHWNCRSALVPVLKSLDELKKDTPKKAKALLEAGKASLLASAAIEASALLLDSKLVRPYVQAFEDWLRKQTKEVVEEVLGSKKAAMWASGKIPNLRSLLSQKSRALRVKDLARKYSQDTNMLPAEFAMKLLPLLRVTSPMDYIDDKTLKLVGPAIKKLLPHHYPLMSEGDHLLTHQLNKKVAGGLFWAEELLAHYARLKKLAKPYKFLLEDEPVSFDTLRKLQSTIVPQLREGGVITAKTADLLDDLWNAAVRLADPLVTYYGVAAPRVQAIPKVGDVVKLPGIPWMSADLDWVVDWTTKSSPYAVKNGPFPSMVLYQVALPVGTALVVGDADIQEVLLHHDDRYVVVGSEQKPASEVLEQPGDVEDVHVVTMLEETEAHRALAPTNSYVSPQETLFEQMVRTGVSWTPAEFLKQWQAYRDAAPRETLEALSTYTGAEAYLLNEASRRGDLTEEQSKTIEQMFGWTLHLPRTTVFYRGIGSDVPIEHTTGQLLPYRQPFSMSADKEMGDEFGVGKYNNYYTVIVPRGTPVSLGADTEYEVILPPTTDLLVVEEQVVGDDRYYTLLANAHLVMGGQDAGTVLTRLFHQLREAALVSPTPVMRGRKENPAVAALRDLVSEQDFNGVPTVVDKLVNKSELSSKEKQLLHDALRESERLPAATVGYNMKVVPTDGRPKPTIPKPGDLFRFSGIPWVTESFNEMQLMVSEDEYMKRGEDASLFPPLPHVSNEFVLYEVVLPEGTPVVVGEKQIDEIILERDANYMTTRVITLEGSAATQYLLDNTRLDMVQEYSTAEEMASQLFTLDYSDDGGRTVVEVPITLHVVQVVPESAAVQVMGGQDVFTDMFTQAKELGDEEWFWEQEQAREEGVEQLSEDAQTVSANYFTFGYEHMEINSAIAAGDPQYTTAFKELFDAFSFSTPHKTKLFRATATEDTDFVEKWTRKGSTVRSDRIVSSSQERIFADEFVPPTREDMDVTEGLVILHFEIAVPEQSRVMVGTSDEREVAFPPGTDFFIVDVQDSADTEFGLLDDMYDEEDIPEGFREYRVRLLANPHLVMGGKSISDDRDTLTVIEEQYPGLKKGLDTALELDAKQDPNIEWVGVQVPEGENVLGQVLLQMNEVLQEPKTLTYDVPMVPEYNDFYMELGVGEDDMPAPAHVLYTAPNMQRIRAVNDFLEERKEDIDPEQMGRAKFNLELPAGAPVLLLEDGRAVIPEEFEFTITKHEWKRGVLHITAALNADSIPTMDKVPYKGPEPLPTDVLMTRLMRAAGEPHIKAAPDITTQIINRAQIIDDQSYENLFTVAEEQLKFATKKTQKFVEGYFSANVKQYNDAVEAGAYQEEIEEWMTFNATSFPEDRLFFRGVALPNDVAEQWTKVGATVVPKRFKSMTTDVDIASGFIDATLGEAATDNVEDITPVMFNVILPAGANALPGIGREKEMVLPPGTPYQVLKVEDEVMSAAYMDEDDNFQIKEFDGKVITVLAQPQLVFGGEDAITSMFRTAKQHTREEMNALRIERRDKVEQASEAVKDIQEGYLGRDYLDINNKIEKRKRPEWEAFNAWFDVGAITLDSPTLVKRGALLPDDMFPPAMIGRVIEKARATSTTANEWTALEFADTEFALMELEGKEPLIFEMVLPAGTRVLPGNSDEYEFILHPDTKYQVVSIKPETYQFWQEDRTIKTVRLIANPQTLDVVEPTVRTAGGIPVLPFPEGRALVPPPAERPRVYVAVEPQPLSELLDGKAVLDPIRAFADFAEAQEFARANGLTLASATTNRVKENEDGSMDATLVTKLHELYVPDPLAWKETTTLAAQPEPPPPPEKSLVKKLEEQYLPDEFKLDDTVYFIPTGKEGYLDAPTRKRDTGTLAKKKAYRMLQGQSMIATADSVSTGGRLKPVVTDHPFGEDDVLSITGGQLGSQAGFTVTRSDGKKFYVKPELKLNADRARNEVAATKLYEAMGVPVMTAHYVDKLYLPEEFLGKRILENKDTDDIEVSLSPRPGYRAFPAVVAEWLAGKEPRFTKEAVMKDFAADAFMAHWDVHEGNFIKSKGRYHRIDLGGALLYRAMGALKEEQFGEEVGELETLRDPFIAISPEHTEITDAEVESGKKIGVDRVLGLSDELISRIIQRYGPLDLETNKELERIMLARKAYMAEKYPNIRPKPTHRVPNLGQGIGLDYYHFGAFKPFNLYQRAVLEEGLDVSFSDFVLEAIRNKDPWTAELEEYESNPGMVRLAALGTDALLSYIGAMLDAPELDKTEVVYRGSSHDGMHKPGDVVKLNSSTSTSLDWVWAEHFNEFAPATAAERKQARARGYSVLYEIALPEGTRVVVSNEAEFEMLLPPGTSVQITDVQQMDSPVPLSFGTQKVKLYRAVVVSQSQDALLKLQKYVSAAGVELLSEEQRKKKGTGDVVVDGILKTLPKADSDKLLAFLTKMQDNCLPSKGAQ